MPSQKSQGTAAPPVASGPNAASSRPQSAASTIASGTSVSESKLASTREEELNGLLLVRVTEAKNCHFPTNALVPTANADEKSMPYVLIEFDKNQTVVPAKSVETVVNLGVGLHWKHRAHFDVNRDTDLSVTLYAKSASEGAPDIAVGVVKLSPKFADQHIQEGWFSLNQVENQEAKVGEVALQIGYKENNGTTGKSPNIDEFELLKVIGKGSFGKVMQVRKKDTGRIYAMKIIKKAHIVSRSEVSHTLAERNVLAKINHPFIVPLKYSFQSPEKLYLVLAFVNGGELFFHLQNEGKFSEDRAKFYTAELLCALDCLHTYSIIYRDLKPENILLDYTGHIALCDFGLCKLDMKEGLKTNTFCGTPEYLAPELLHNKGYTKVVDWWTLGILLFEMLTGLPPFYDENTNDMYKKILSEPLVIPDEISQASRDLLTKLLDRNPEKRLGANGAEEIKKHPFFADIQWNKLMAKKYVPPFKPEVESATDTSNFDQEFTSEPAMDSVIPDSHLSATVQQQFAGFSYANTNSSMVASSLSDKTAKLSINQPTYQKASIREQVGIKK
ncbi:MAG: hypothetical protein SGCHY_002257 [Lobulomycetales sp.]